MNSRQKSREGQSDACAGVRSLPDVDPGDTLNGNVRVVEGGRERVQAYEGVCVARSNRGVNSSFTVRKISYGEGVERSFPLYSPRIESITVVRRGDARRDRKSTRLNSSH